jgi:hypothetical protein
LLAAAIGSPRTARAGVDGDVVLGTSNAATTETAITNNTNNNTVFHATNLQGGSGVSGETNFGIGVGGYAIGNGVGVQAGNGSQTQPALLSQASGGGTAVLGYSGGFESPPAPELKTGVLGVATQDSASRGVCGRSTAGVGVYAEATGGLALRTVGRTRLGTSGVATIPTASDRVTVDPGVNVVSGSFVLLTPKANIGSRALWFSTNTNANTFTIRMSSARSSSTPVAWLLLG